MEEPKKEKQPFIFETSWDDGWKYDLQVADLLEKYNLPGTFYIIVDAVGKGEHLTWEQIKELDKRGFEIGSHTMTHPSDLKQLYEADLHYEIQNSKDLLETVLGHTISKFCYPRGRLDDRVLAMVQQAGYTHARVTGKPGKTVIENNFRVPGTIHVFQREEYGDVPFVEYAKNVIYEAKRKGGYVNLWGHSKEVLEKGLWKELEVVLKYVSLL